MKARIADNGIPKAIKDKIFQHSFTTKPTRSGTGLKAISTYSILKTYGTILGVHFTTNGNFVLINYLSMRYLQTVLLVLYGSFTGFAQQNSVLHLGSLPSKGILLDKGWKWKAGDNPDFAKPDFDDHEWEAINPAHDIHDLAQVRKAEIGWFRLRLQVGQSIVNQPLTLALSQVGASEFILMENCFTAMAR